MSEDELVIEIPQDDAAPPESKVETTDKVDKVEKAAEAAPKKQDDKVVTADQGVEDLKKQLQEAKERSERAEAARLKAAEDLRKAKEEGSRFRDEGEKAQFDLLTGAIESTNREAEFATKEYEDALSAGDFKKAAEAQRKMSRAEARLAQLEDGKSAFERQLEERKNRPEPKVEDVGDPVEKYIGQFSPRSQSWLREHKDFVTENKKNLRLIAAHNEAVAEDYVPDSDAYFDFLETRLGLKAQPVAEPEHKQTPPARSRAMPAAPVSHSANGNGGMSSSQIVLTKGEQDSATDGTIVWNYDDPKGKFKRGEPIGLQEMARRKAALQKQGAYDRAYSDQ